MEITVGELKKQILGHVEDHLKEIDKRVAEKVDEAVTKSLEAKGTTAPPFADAKPRVERKPGDALARYVRAVALTSARKQPITEVPTILSGWGDKDLADLCYKSLTSTNPDEGGFLVPEQFSTEFVELLRPASIIRNAGARVLPMPTGSLTISRQTAGVSGTWIGEASNAGKAEPKFGQLRLTSKKLSVLVPVSNDLMSRSSPSVDAIVRGDMVRGMGQTESADFLRADGTEFTPKGLRNWIKTANVISSAGTSLANIETDLGTAILRLVDANVPMTNPHWFMSPRTWNKLMTIRQGAAADEAYAFRQEMLGGRLWGWPFTRTTHVPVNLTVGANSDTTELYLVDMDDVLIGQEMALSVAASDTAAYHDGNAVQAAFSRDETVVRALEKVDIVMRRDESIAVVVNVRYGA